MLTLGVIADTHIPDRARQVPPLVFTIFKQAKVTEILHAGDISTQRVLDQLEEIAPVQAVRGNRDWFVKNLPMHMTLKYEDVTIGLTHGHGSFRGYILDKLHYFLRGPRKFAYVENIALGIFPEADVIVFGHNHVPVNRRMDNGQLLFNPGSPTIPNFFVKNVPTCVGLIHIDGSMVEGEIVEITN